MTSRFAVSHSWGAHGMREILHRQLETAVAELPRRRATDEQIHRARKHMKAARATLRLLRPLLSEARYRRENRALRDAARTLSAARDDTVLVKTLGELAQHMQGTRKRRGLAAFEARLRRDASRRRSELERHGLRQSAARLRTALAMVDSWPATPEDWKPVYRSLRNTYRKGRRCVRSNARHASGPAQWPANGPQGGHRLAEAHR
jgi:CHAD domain